MKTSTRVFFKKMQKDDKKTVVQLELKGNVSDDKMTQLMNMAGTIVDVDFITPQVEMDFEQPHQGVEYNVNNDGTVDVDDNQIEMDLELGAEKEVAAALEEVPFTDEELECSEQEQAEWENDGPIEDEGMPEELI